MGSEEDFKEGELEFSMTSLTTSEGDDRSNCRDRYLAIHRFPTADTHGKGQYIFRGKVTSEFTFKCGALDSFDAEQQNGRPFVLTPVIKAEKPTGFIWTMPDEYSKFEARFCLSEAKRKRNAEIRNTSSFLDFKRRRCPKLARLESRENKNPFRNKLIRKSKMCENFQEEVGKRSIRVDISHEETLRVRKNSD